MHNSKQLKCEFHNLPIVKIETHSKRILCQKCCHEPADERKNRLEILRLKLTKNYQIEFNELKQMKQKVDRTCQLFQAKNITEVKKIINKTLPELQKHIEKLLETEIHEANQQLKVFIESELKPWKDVEGKQLKADFLLFEEEYAEIEGRITDLKAKLKSEMASKLKSIVRNYYQEIFGF